MVAIPFALQAFLAPALALPFIALALAMVVALWSFYWINLGLARGTRETDFVSWVAMVFCCAHGGRVLLLIAKTMGTLGSWLEIQEVSGASPPSEDA